MNKQRLMAVTIAAAASLASPLCAAGSSGVFFGGGYSMATIDAELVEGSSTEFGMGALDIAGGMMFNEFLGFDARLGLGVSDDKKAVPISVLKPEFTTKLKNYYGLYLRPQYQMDRFQVYGLLGYAGADVEISAEDTNILVDGEGSGTSYGAGIGFSPEGSLFFNLEYMNMIAADNYDFSAINLRIEFKM